MPSALPAFLLLAAACGGVHAGDCSAQSPATRTPVIELYTSEGCSSCPPADKWASGLKGKDLVVQAFHVGYWDYIGWVDRFASPGHTARQREIAARGGLGNIYTPQVVRDGQDWRDYARALAAPPQPATAAIRLARMGDAVEAEVTAGGAWSAYWTVTEHGHASKVSAGENAGEMLKHDFVVRQYVPAGQYQGAQKLKLRPVAATPGHAQQVNLVVVEARSAKPLQALSLQCS
jgi:hypothetical protein